MLGNYLQQTTAADQTFYCQEKDLKISSAAHFVYTSACAFQIAVCRQTVWILIIIGLHLVILASYGTACNHNFGSERVLAKYSLSADVICCTFLFTQNVLFILHAYSMDTDKTAPYGSALFEIWASYIIWHCRLLQNFDGETIFAKCSLLLFPGILSGIPECIRSLQSDCSTGTT